ncbi:MAG TPA: response regulator transcription factor [Bryobacteraceae bacterium]|nr:response regulator transcription factor [Bryobacteraceae bacterium]
MRVVIAAPTAVMRAGLEALIASAPEIEMAGSFPDLSSVEALRPDVILAALPFDELGPPHDGPAPAIVLLSDEGQPSWTQEALRAGVRAVLPRDAAPAEVLAAVDAAANGMAVLDPHDLETLLAASSPAAAAEAPALTPRELEVLRLMAEGAANKNIAWKLGISEHTVKFHVASILGKLHAGTRTEAVALGMRKGLILI